MKIALLGDILLSGKFCVNNNPDVYAYFKDVAEYLKQYDYVIGNLETAFVKNQRPFSPKSAHVKSDVENIDLLKYLNIGIVNLANNHIYDFGEESYELTKSLLIENNIEYFGVDNKQIFLDDNTAQVALHGYCCYSTNPFGLDKGVNKLDIDLVTDVMKMNENDGFLNIISVHGGQEHVHTPSYDYVRMARQFSLECPYVLYGHHPHVIQSFEEYKDSLIAYSLGNFCIDEVYTKKSVHPIFVPSKENKSSFILELDINKNRIESYKVIPFYIDDDCIRVGSKEILASIKGYSEELNKDPLMYQQERQEKITKYIESRRALRDLNWYLKRLNFGSVQQILATRRNSKLYKKYVIDKLL